MKVAKISLSLLLLSCLLSLVVAGGRSSGRGRNRPGRCKGNCESGGGSSDGDSSDGGSSGNSPGNGGGRGGTGKGKNARTQRPNWSLQDEAQQTQNSAGLVGNAGTARLLSSTKSLRSSSSGRKLADADLLGNVTACTTAIMTLGNNMAAFETDMTALSEMVDDTAFDAATLASTVATHQATLDTIRSDMTAIQDLYFSIVATIESVINDENAAIQTIQDAMETETNDSQNIVHLKAIIGHQQDASNLEGIKEELETLVQVLAIKVDNCDDYDADLELMSRLAGDASVYDDEVCIFDQYGECTYTNGFCDDGYFFFTNTLSKVKTVSLSGTPSSITVYLVATCGHHFGNDGFDIFFNNVAVGTIYEGIHCNCDPPLLSLAVSDLASIPSGSTTFDLKIVSRNTQGYIAESFAQVHYGVIA